MPTGTGAGEGQQASGIEPAAVGGKGEGIFWGAFLWFPQPHRTWDGLACGDTRVPLIPRDHWCLSGTLWPTHIWAQSPPELPLRPRRVPPNRPGWQQLACARGGARRPSQQMPPLSSFLFRCPQLPPSVHSPPASSLPMVPLAIGGWHKCCPLAWLAGAGAQARNCGM